MFCCVYLRNSSKIVTNRQLTCCPRNTQAWSSYEGRLLSQRFICSGPVCVASVGQTSQIIYDTRVQLHHKFAEASKLGILNFFINLNVNVTLEQEAMAFLSKLDVWVVEHWGVFLLFTWSLMFQVDVLICGVTFFLQRCTSRLHNFLQCKHSFFFFFI